MAKRKAAPPKPAKRDHRWGGAGYVCYDCGAIKDTDMEAEPCSGPAESSKPPEPKFRTGDIVRSPDGKLWRFSHAKLYSGIHVAPVGKNGNPDQRQVGWLIPADGVGLVRHEWLCPERAEYGCDKPLRWLRGWTSDEFGMPVKYDVFRCQTCKTKYVGRNNDEPQLTTDPSL